MLVLRMIQGFGRRQISLCYLAEAPGPTGADRRKLERWAIAKILFGSRGAVATGSFETLRAGDGGFCSCSALGSALPKGSTSMPIQKQLAAAPETLSLRQ